MTVLWKTSPAAVLIVLSLIVGCNVSPTAPKAAAPQTTTVPSAKTGVSAASKPGSRPVARSAATRPAPPIVPPENVNDLLLLLERFGTAYRTVSADFTLETVTTSGPRELQFSTGYVVFKADETILHSHIHRDLRETVIRGINIPPSTQPEKQRVLNSSDEFFSLDDAGRAIQTELNSHPGGELNIFRMKFGDAHGPTPPASVPGVRWRLYSLGNGFFPLPFGQDAKELRRRHNISWKSAEMDGKPAYMLFLKPKKAGGFFGHSEVTLTLDHSGVPVTVIVNRYDRYGVLVETQTCRYRNVWVNVPVPFDAFDARKIEHPEKKGPEEFWEPYFRLSEKDGSLIPDTSKVREKAPRPAGGAVK